MLCRAAYYPLIEPARVPETKYRCNTRKNTTTGTVARMVPAAIKRQLALKAPCKCTSPTGNVYICGLDNTMLGHKNSPQLAIKVNTARVARVGLIKGSIT